jgi:predicted enzyme related to lactoylglutathione lyase
MSVGSAGRRSPESNMHKSRLAGFIIDCQTDDLPAAATFWSGALGMEQRQLSPEESGQYIGLVDPGQRLHVEVQAVTHPSRVHLDIETDDIEAEVRRLEALGAARVKKINTWWVMQAPTGQRFCVVRKQSAAFDGDARQWS